MLMETTVRGHRIPVRMATVNTHTEKTSAGTGVEKWEPLCIAGSNIERCSHYGTVWPFLS